MGDATALGSFLDLTPFLLSDEAIAGSDIPPAWRCGACLHVRRRVCVGMSISI
jgi:hypothetical protein